MNFRTEAHGLFAYAVFDDLFNPIERAAADEQNVRGIDLDEILVRMLAPALRRHAGDGAFQDLEQRLLHAFAAHIARDGDILALAGDFVDFIDVHDAALGEFHIVIRVLNQAEQHIFDVFAHIPGLREVGGIANGKGNVQNLSQSLREVRFAAARGAQHHDIGLLQFHLVLPALRLVMNALIVVVYRHGKRALGGFLTDHVLIEHIADFARRAQHKLRHVASGWRHIVRNHALAKRDALIADVHARASDHFADLQLRLAAE